jgi:hypothetical protein
MNIRINQSINFSQLMAHIASSRKYLPPSARTVPDSTSNTNFRQAPIKPTTGLDLGERFSGFRVWKWKHLLSRRQQFVPVLCGVSLVVWLSMASTSVNKEEHVAVQSIVFSFSQIYIVLFVALFMIPQTRTLLRGSIGLKICALIMLSVFPMLFCLRHIKDMWPSTVCDIAASFVTMLWLMCVHHLGFPDRLSWIMACALIIMWLTYYVADVESYCQVVVILIIFGCMTIAYGNSLVEAEYRKMYERENIASEKKLDMNLTDVSLALSKIDDDLNVLRDQCESMVRQKMTTTQSRSINRHLLRESDSTAQHLRYSLSAVMMAVTEHPEMINDSNCISEKLNRALLFSASFSGRRTNRADLMAADPGKVRSLASLCAELFVACEVVMDRGCALFYDQSSPDVMIKSSSNAVKLMLMLIIEDTLRLGEPEGQIPPGMVNISVQKQGTEIFLVIRRTLLKSDATVLRMVDIDEDINGSVRLRLAQRIAKTHLGTKLEIADLERDSSIMVSIINVHLPEDIFEANKANSSNDFPELCPWYIIEYQKSSDDKGHIKNQLNTLSIPHRSIHVYSLPNVKVKSKVAVVHDQWWRTHHHTIVAQILDIASCIIVITSGVDAPTLFKYEENSGSATIVKVPATINTVDLFHAVQMLISRRYPKSGVLLPDLEPVMFPSPMTQPEAKGVVSPAKPIAETEDNKLEMDDEKELDQSLMNAWKRQLNAFEITFVTTQSLELGARISAQKSIEVMEAHAAINYEALYFSIVSKLPQVTKKKHKSEVCALSQSQRVSKLLIDDFLIEVSRAEERFVTSNLNDAMGILNHLDERAQFYGIEVLRQWILVVVFCMGELAENIIEPTSEEVLRADSHDSNEGLGVGGASARNGSSPTDSAGIATGFEGQGPSRTVQTNPLASGGIVTVPADFSAASGAAQTSPSDSPNMYERSAFSSSSSMISSGSPFSPAAKQSLSQSITLPPGGVGLVAAAAESPKKR